MWRIDVLTCGCTLAMSMSVCVCVCAGQRQCHGHVLTHTPALTLSLLLSQLAEVQCVLSLVCDRSLQNKPSSLGGEIRIHHGR